MTYMFTQASNGAWVRTEIPPISLTRSSQQCGRSVKVINSLTIAIGCDRYINYGAVQILTRPSTTSTTWTQKQLISRPKLTPISESFGFNIGVSEDGKQLGIGAPYADDDVSLTEHPLD
jgi:hypothetical protein